jgi:putative spermidine/putrescine transport system ATP-binding protein
MTAYLRIESLTRRHPGCAIPALDGFTLDVSRGEALALLGPSGSGKTTALRLVAGLDEPDSGDILLAGRSLAGVPPERRGISLVFQRPLLFPHLSVLDNVAFSPRMAGASRADARREAGRFLELVQLGGYGERSVRALSGGQEQRVALARALAAEPDVLLLDEPFSALDPGLRADMHRLLAELRAVLEPTIILVTHDQYEATVVADTVAVLVDGQLLQRGTSHELYTRPASLIVSRFLGCSNEIPGAVRDEVHRSSLGELGVPGTQDGDGVLTIRQEAVSLTNTSDGTADAMGQVTAITSTGARRTITVRCNEVTITAEVGPAMVVSLGDRVGVSLPLSQRHVIPLPPAVSVSVG